MLLGIPAGGVTPVFAIPAWEEALAIPSPEGVTSASLGSRHREKGFSSFGAVLTAHRTTQFSMSIDPSSKGFLAS